MPTDRLRVIVVDDHHHVLPEIHFAIRRRVLPFQGIALVHVDSHADLSFPASFDAAQIFAPESLYEMLDESASGIAEFLLPLVYARHVQSLTWLQAPWSTQINAGSMREISIGCHQDTQQLALSCPWPHFVDEKLYVPEDELEVDTIQHFDLFVGKLGDSSIVEAEPTAWILDIDLDYFSTWNPFYQELVAHCDALTLSILRQVFCELRSPARLLSMPERLRDHQNAVDEWLEQVKREGLYAAPASIESQAACQILETLCEDPTATHDILMRFLEVLNSFDEDTLKLVWEDGPCLSLPHHESSSHEIEEMMLQFRAFIDMTCQHHHQPPSLVTIATSAMDEYLPPHQVENVLTSVLEIIADIFADSHDIDFCNVDEQPVMSRALESDRLKRILAPRCE